MCQHSVSMTTISSTLDTTVKSNEEEGFKEDTDEIVEKLVYVNENAMDCNYDESNDTSKNLETLPEPSSPEMFASDAEDEPDKDKSLADQEKRVDAGVSTVEDRKTYTQEELVAMSDCYLLARMNKFLSGVPPPPSHTISQKDCTEFLMYIRQNREYFWVEPIDKDDKDKVLSHDKAKNRSNEKNAESDSTKNNIYQRPRKGSRNLSNAFDACDTSINTTSDKDLLSKSSNICEISSNSTINVLQSGDMTRMYNIMEDDCSTTCASINSSIACKDWTSKEPLDNPSLLRYCTTNKDEASGLSWPEAFQHKFHGIHYNRSKVIEEFENLTTKMCERYVGAETQSTCNVWFTKQAPGSARKRSLLAKRNIGQSPGKRLSHLARRRRTFSSANLQGLGLPDKKHIVLNVKKPIVRKGKSPRGKSPRGKSPRGSAKKRASRRLSLEGPSPRKVKLETSKRALFQSPPGDRAGPSKLLASTSANPQKIKRALFPTPKKKEENSEVFERVNFEESRKRKCEDELEGPRLKWAKSLSFDCPYDLGNASMGSWDRDRHSTGSLKSKSETAFQNDKCELSDTRRKKLLWAVAEALRSKGIGMGHPRFKQYASNLARTVKKLMPDLENKNLPRKPGSTSDRMLKLAKHHVLFVLETKKTIVSDS
ncbi:uncharacterized protein LOC105702118 [Orussus abietinus]|uniref:uncharacterized protein LOC105702118 n=1 Tax=Orussus abietinus TaxID=222816 RepID=UPI0006265DB5|nr:uncharacterized protein LOC105702118 [Orussus abietinus]